MQASSPLVFYFDFISPYAFLAWTQLPALAKRCRTTLEPVPVLFAGLLDAHGQKGPAEIPAKRRYLFKDIARKARRLGFPSISAPPAHPFNPLLSLRISYLPRRRRTQRNASVPPRKPPSRAGSSASRR
jgi:2-hydroxychromene-2-carboxylate isomerase